MESARHQELVKALFERGIDHGNDLLGVHGTSIEAIRRLIKNGSLPSSSEARCGRGTDHFLAGWLCFFPTQGTMPDHELTPTFHRNLDDATKDAAGYAESIAGEHAFLIEMGIGLEDSRFQRQSRDLANAVCREAITIGKLRSLFNDAEANDLLEHLMELRKTHEEILSAVNRIAQRRGIVVAIAKSAAAVMQLANGDEQEGDLRLYCPNGLSIEHIVGIEPMGDLEYDELDQLSGNG